MTDLNNPTANSKAVPNIQPNFKCPMDQSHTLMNTKKLTCHEQGFESTSLSNLRSPEQGHRTNRPPLLPKPPTTATAPHLNPPRGQAGGEKKSPTQRRLLIPGRRRAPPRPPPHQLANLPRMEMEARHCWLGFARVQLMGLRLGLLCTYILYYGPEEEIIHLFTMVRSLVFFFKLQNRASFFFHFQKHISYLLCSARIGSHGIFIFQKK